MIRLFTNYYEDKNRSRHLEISECFERNRNNKELYSTYLVIDAPGYTSFADERYSQIIVDERPTFEKFFQLIQIYCNDGDIAVIANSDIFFDETIKLAENIKENECYALSRWDVNAKGMAVPFHRADSQDVWIFRTPIKEIQGADFTMGRAGCDQVIAYLLEKHGYKVTNPCKSIHAFHLHLSGVRNYIEKGKVIDRIPPPYKMVIPTEL